LTIPDSVEYIGSRAFAQNDLSSVIFDGYGRYDNSAFNGNPNLKKIFTSSNDWSDYGDFGGLPIEYVLGPIETYISAIPAIVPKIKVDVYDAPSITVQYRMKMRAGSGWMEEFCPKKIKLEFKKMGSATWKALSIMREAQFGDCAYGSKKGYRQLEFQPEGAGEIRAVVDGTVTASKTVKAVAAKNKFRFAEVSTNIISAKWIGRPVTMSADVEQQLTNGTWVVPLVPPGKVFLQQYVNGRWKYVGVCRNSPRLGGNYRCGSATNAKGLRLRLVYGKLTTTSATSNAKPVTFSHLEWNEPSCYLVGGVTFIVDAIGSDGENYAKNVKIILQYRNSRSNPWETIDLATYSGSTVVLKDPHCYTTRYYRLSIPGLYSREFQFN
jgi:hypothetical protein